SPAETGRRAATAPRNAPGAGVTARRRSSAPRASRRASRSTLDSGCAGCGVWESAMAHLLSTRGQPLAKHRKRRAIPRRQRAAALPQRDRRLIEREPRPLVQEHDVALVDRQFVDQPQERIPLPVPLASLARPVLRPRVPPLALPEPPLGPLQVQGRAP